MSTPLYVYARFRAKKNSVEKMKRLLAEFATETLKKEPGCIAYTYLQSVEDETLFTSSELWQNEEAEAAHWSTNHLKDLLEVFPEVSEGEVEVFKYNRI